MSNPLYLPIAIRATAEHIRGCRDGNGHNPYINLLGDADQIEQAANEIDQLRADKAELVEALERARDGMSVVNPSPARRADALSHVIAVLNKHKENEQ